MKRNTSLPWIAVAAMALAILAGAPAAASTVNDIPEDALQFAFVGAYRYEGNQPVDLIAKVVDAQGMQIEGATVMVEISTGRSAQVRRIQLGDQRNGSYLACDAAFLDGASDEDVYRFTATKDRMHPAVAEVKSDRGNLCGAGQPQIRIASVHAAKLDGPGQPLSVLVDLVDDGGNAVTGAYVRVSVNDTNAQVDANLSEVGGGRYSDCNVGTFDTTGPGQVAITVYAAARGYRPAAAVAENTVGYLCSTPVHEQTTARRTR